MLWNHRAVQKGILRKGFCMRRFFQKIGMAFSRFMYGRNGNDRLCLVLMWVYLALWLVSMVTAALNLEITSIVIWGFQVITLSYWLFRILSKNVMKRRREVERFFGFFRNKHGYADDEGKWDRVPTKIDMDELLSVDVIVNESVQKPDKEEKK